MRRTGARGAAVTAAVPAPDVRGLARRVACIPYGLALVQFGVPECVAAALEVPTELVERAQHALADPSLRPTLVADYEQSTQRYQSTPGAFCDTCPAISSAAGRGCPHALIKEAERRPSGIEFLLSTSLEAAAISFQVHPFVVLGAIAILARRGCAADMARAEGAAGNAG